VIRLLDLKLVLGRRLVCRLLQAGLIVPIAHDARGHPLFDAVALHRTLGALARATALIEPRVYQPGNGARQRGSKKNDEIEIDVERALAQLDEGF
jgi:hypothetical protein